MATNYVQKGDTLKVTAPADVSSGDFGKHNDLIVVYLADADAGEEVEVAVRGVFGDAPKATGETWAFGQTLYWSETNSSLTTTSTDNTKAGHATAAAASADEEGEIRLAQ